MSKGSPISVDEKKWQAEEDLRSLRRVEEIKADRKRYSAAQLLAKKEVQALSRISPRSNKTTKGKGKK